MNGGWKWLKLWRVIYGDALGFNGCAVDQKAPSPLSCVCFCRFVTSGHFPLCLDAGGFLMCQAFLLEMLQ
jgi:hypothetical protein